MNDRGVSTTLNYVLSLGIASLLVTGLLLAGGTFVEDRQRQVIRSELSVIGEQIASDVNRADRLLTAGNVATTVTVNQSFPTRLTGTGYDIELNQANGELVLSSVDPEVEVSVTVETESTLVDSNADGGIVVVQSTGNELEITNG